MVEDRGFEPKKAPEHSGSKSEQTDRNRQINQGLEREAGADREAAGERLERAGIHNRSITEPATFPPDLKALVDAWPDLSENARREIARILETEKKARR